MKEDDRKTSIMRRILLLCPPRTHTHTHTHTQIRSFTRRADRKLQDITPLEVTYYAFV